ncbi:MAG: hypothetical protein Kow0069_10460 [Promethearchaeota archaeon]
MYYPPKMTQIKSKTKRSFSSFAMGMGRRNESITNLKSFARRLAVMRDEEQTALIRRQLAGLLVRLLVVVSILA